MGGATRGNLVDVFEVEEVNIGKLHGRDVDVLGVEQTGAGLTLVASPPQATDLDLSIHAHPMLSETEEEAVAAFLGHSTHILPPRR